MRKSSTRSGRLSAIRGALLIAAALIVLITYPLGVAWILLATQHVGLNPLKRVWYALGWPLLTFVALMDEARKHLPHPAAT